MTQEQLDVACKHLEFHKQQFGFGNVEFKKGFIEDLAAAGIASESVDLIVSNCVVNLSPDKESVLREAFRVLKWGGEMYFSDVYSDRRVPKELLLDPVLYGECLSGALYWNDFLRLARKTGFTDPRLVETHRLGLGNPEIEALVGHIAFTSTTYRLWKLRGLESDCEDYGQAVVYRGTVPTARRVFTLDSHHAIEAGRVFAVCGNTYAMLHDTRLAPHFKFLEPESKVHLGLFAACGKKEGAPQFTDDGAASGGSCCSGGGGCC
eukprot:TRINITY_DN3607_c0_g1_i1.p1 TRINITY_DN3607_c0_g1~~TRINITY_DN3607_c0_g1_i1.p1  ORF type:complete len:264 (+),score=80.67 TRINITY_DN3607_c0_g1_i1:445-1236(+)